MSKLTVLRWLFGDDHDCVVYECRDCGTSVEAETGSCPKCGSERIAEYRL